MRGIRRASAHCFPDTAQETCGSVSTAGHLINNGTAVCCFRATPEKINHGKQHNLENKTDDEQLLIAAWLKSEEAGVEVELSDVVENPAGSDVADIHYHVDDRERDRPLCDCRVAPCCCQQHRCAERFTDCQRKNATSERQRWDCRNDHHAASNCANGNAQEKRPTQPDRVCDRTGQQSEDRHCGRPHPADQRPGCLIAEPKVLRQPQHHRLVRDRVRRVNEKLNQKREPQLALRALKNSELRYEAAQTCGFSDRHSFFLRDYFFGCLAHGAELFRHSERSRGARDVLHGRATGSFNFTSLRSRWQLRLHAEPCRQNFIAAQRATSVKSRASLRNLRLQIRARADRVTPQNTTAQPWSVQRTADRSMWRKQNPPHSDVHSGHRACRSLKPACRSNAKIQKLADSAGQNA